MDVLPVAVASWAARTPAKAAVRHVDGSALSYVELDAYARRWAAYFAAQGVRAGDTVVCVLRPSFEVIGAWLGLGWLRAIMVPVNPDLRGSLLRHALTLAGARLAVVDPPSVPFVAEAAPSVRVVAVGSVDLPSPLAVPLPGGPPRASDIATVPFTSGTTGPSKGVAVPWRQIADMSRSISQFGVYTSDDVYYCPFPWYHASSMFAFNLMALVGGTLVIRDKFSASRFLPDVRRFGCTSTMLIGAMATFLAAQPERPDDADSPLVRILMAPLVKNLDAFRKRFGVRVSTYYNMTEMSGPLVSSGFDPVDPTACGRLAPHFEARLVDDADEEVPVGSVGELVVRPKRPWSMMAGYWNNPIGTVEAWRNLWFHTGDLFRVDSEGNYYLIDRRKDSIRRRGENISSWELESEIIEYPGVVECAAVAMPSAHSEDEVRVFVVAGPGFEPDGLFAFLRGRLPGFMLPSVIDVVESMPKTPTERVQKHLLRAVPLDASSWTAPGFTR